MSAVTNLGKVSVTPKGTWANNTAYDILDIVAYNGSSYIAIQDVPSSGVPLSNTSYWLMIASKGDGGEITSVSASISGGYGTPGVTVTEGGTDHEKTLAFAFTNLVGLGISSITQTTTSSVSGGTNIITCTLTDGNSVTFAVLNGTDGDAINIAPSYDSTATYNLGDLVVYNDTLYECTTAISVAEAWDATHWTQTDVSNQLSRKANIDGSYDLMNTGTSDNWTPYSADSGATQDIPFLNEGTGCGNGESVVDTGSYLQFKKKLGNTKSVNQLLNKANYPASSGVFTNNGDGSVTANGTASSTQTFVFDTFVNEFFIKGHKYYVYSGLASTGSSSTFELMITAFSGNGNLNLYTAATIAEYNSNLTNLHDVQAVVRAGTTVSNLKFSPLIIDLTLWFGSNDAIPSHLLSHPEDWGRYYAGSLAYNAGTLESADGTVMKSIGRNVWDEVTETGTIDTSTGQNSPNSTMLRCKNYIPVIPNTAYYFRTVSNGAIIYYYDASYNYIGFHSGFSVNAPFTTSTNAHFMRFRLSSDYGTVYKSDITISLYYPDESGYDQYYPYTVLAEVDTGSEGLRSAGAVADEKTPDGTITRKVGYVDLGSLSWTMDTSGTYPVFWASISGMKIAEANVRCQKYAFYGARAWQGFVANDYDKLIATPTAATYAYVMIQDSSYSTAAAFKTAMDGVYLYYELATPTTEQGTAFAENIPCDDFGSLSWTQTKGIPQGNEIFYPVDYKASFDTLYNIVDGDMSALATDDELQAVADRIPAAPDADGTYTLKATVSSGTKTYSWVADE